jgi:hypothetical protein
MFEVDLDASPRTLHVFVNDEEEPLFFTNIPESVNFGVSICPLGSRLAS